MKYKIMYAMAWIMLLVGVHIVMNGEQKPTMICKDVTGNKAEVFVYELTDGNKTLLTHGGAEYRFNDCELKDK